MLLVLLFDLDESHPTARAAQSPSPAIPIGIELHLRRCAAVSLYSTEINVGPKTRKSSMSFSDALPLNSIFAFPVDRATADHVNHNI